MLNIPIVQGAIEVIDYIAGTTVYYINCPKCNMQMIDAYDEVCTNCKNQLPAKPALFPTAVVKGKV